MSRNLAVAVARAPYVRVRGEFLRHTSPKERTLAGRPSGGRWAPTGAFPVLYLGRPEPSVVIEAYRHLVDGSEFMTPEMVGPRRLIRANVDVDQIVDLTEPDAIASLGLDPEQLRTEPGDYAACQELGAAAHQLGRKGVLAPAAEGGGQTLALFTNHLAKADMPTVVSEEIWTTLPTDPRSLRAVSEEDTA